MACKYCGLPKFSIYAYTIRVDPKTNGYVEKYVPVIYCPKCGEKISTEDDTSSRSENP